MGCPPARPAEALGQLLAYTALAGCTAAWLWQPGQAPNSRHAQLVTLQLMTLQGSPSLRPISRVFVGLVGIAIRVHGGHEPQVHAVYDPPGGGQRCMVDTQPLGQPEQQLPAGASQGHRT